MLASLFAAGCAGTAVHRQPAPATLAEPWPTTPGTSVDGIAASELHWRNYFADPHLQALIDTTLANNRDLRIAALRVEEARAAFRIQRSTQFPDLNLGAQGARARVPGDLNASGAAAIGGEYRAEVGLGSWELDLWGRVRSLKESALRTWLATDAARHGIEVALIAQVADGWLALRELDERIELARQTVATREDALRIFSRRHEVGATSRLDLAQVEILHAQAESLQAQLEQARALQANALAELVGAPLPAAKDAAGAALSFPALRVGLPSDLLVDRPDLIAAEQRLRAAEADIAAARAAFFPRIALTGSYGSASAELDGLFESGSRAWTFAPTLSLPIFDGGRRRANLELSEVRRDIAVADYEKTIQAAFRDVADALAARHWLAQQLALQEQALVSQGERARLAKLRYDNGSAAYLEVLDAQRDLLASQQQRVQLQGALHASAVALYAALGGGPPPASPAFSESPSMPRPRPQP